MPKSKPAGGIAKIIKKLGQIFSRRKNTSARSSKSASLKKTSRKLKKPTTLKSGVSLAGKLHRSNKNPIISPRAANGWEVWQTFNPGVIFLNNKFHFIYRAIGHDGLSRFGYAASADGSLISDRPDAPAYQHQIKTKTFNVYSYLSGGSWGGAEDPRIVRVDKEDRLYMTYTACGDGGLGVALTSIKIKDFINKKWNWRAPRIISKPGQVHKNWVVFPSKINGKYAILHSINPSIQIEYLNDLDFKKINYINSYYGGGLRKKCWDSWVRGVGPPPVKTDRGWLLFYHAMNGHDFSKYKIGAMLLDLKDPTKIICRSKMPVLEPTEAYENNGFKSGVVYASGAVIKNGELFIYYGGSDSYVCVAKTNPKEFLDHLTKGEETSLKLKTIKKKNK